MSVSWVVLGRDCIGVLFFTQRLYLRSTLLTQQQIGDRGRQKAEGNRSGQN